MDTLLDEDERAVQAQARSFLASACSTVLVRECEKNGKYSRELWAKITDLGWLDICLPENAGGLGLPLSYLGLLFEEAGRHLAPIPLLSVVVPSLVLARYGLPQHGESLSRIRKGELLLSFAVQEDGGSWNADSIQLTGHRDGDTVVLNGTKHFVDNFGISEKCLVAFRCADAQSGLSLALVDTSAPNVSHVELVTTAKDSQAAVTFADVRVPLSDIVGEFGNAEEPIKYLMDCATVLLAAQLVGAARKATELAIEYAKQRYAFEQPIGSFQAIQHLCADMINGVDGSELLTREAIWRLGNRLDAAVQISQAKAFANEKCLMACRSAQQIHGGIGFMMEFDMHLWYRRVVAWGLRGGTTAEHRRRVSEALFRNTSKLRLDSVAVA